MTERRKFLQVITVNQQCTQIFYTDGLETSKTKIRLSDLKKQ